MKNATVGSKKVLKAAQARRVAGVPVRSGVKAGRMTDFQKERIGGDGGRRSRLG